MTGRLSNRVAAADPGHARLWNAARAVASVAATVALVSLIARSDNLPPRIEIIGAALAMQAAIAISDRDRNAQRLTTLLLLPAAAPSVALGIAVSHNRLLSDAVFLALIFGGIYIRRFGPRYYALGMVGMLAYFFSIYLRLRFTLLPWALVSQAVGVACSFLFRFVVFPDRADRSLVSATRAFLARQSLLASVLLKAARGGCWDEREDRRATDSLLQLNEVGLMIDSILGGSETDRGGALDRVRAALVDAEVAAADLVSAVEQSVECDKPASPKALQKLAFLEDPVGLAQPGVPDFDGDRSEDDAIMFAADDLRQALRHLSTEISGIQVKNRQWAPRVNYNIQSKPSGLHATTRLAIQATIASAAAIAIGETVSSARWYWAVLAVIVTYAGTWSRGAALSKAWSRVIGTLLGLGVGMFTVGLIGDRKPAALVLIFICLFGFVFFVRTSYGTAVVFLTTLLAGLYVELGMMSPSILRLRLIETSIGAVLGFVISSVVLPLRTRDVVREAVVEALHRLRDVVTKSVDVLAGEGNPADAIDAGRQFDEAMHNLQAKMRPYISPSLLGGGAAQTWLLTLAAAGYYGKLFSRAAFEAAEDKSAENSSEMEAVRDACRSLTANIDAAEKALATPSKIGPVPKRGEEPLLSGLVAEERRPDLVESLRHIDRAVQQLQQLPA